jgi:hypothetical protein
MSLNSRSNWRKSGRFEMSSKGKLEIRNDIKKLKIKTTLLNSFLFNFEINLIFFSNSHSI